MHADLYHHYLQKLGITLWLPNGFVLPENDQNEAAVSQDQFTHEIDVQAQPASGVSTSMNAQASTRFAEALVTPAKVTESLSISPESRTSTTKATIQPLVCTIKNSDGARLTVVASPGNDPRNEPRGSGARAENLLDNMLSTIGINADNYSLVQVAREQDQSKQALSANVVWVCGQLAASLLFNRPVVLASMRGKIHHIGQTKVIVSYHPDELRKNALLKKMAWQDLRLLAVALTQDQ